MCIWPGTRARPARRSNGSSSACATRQSSNTFWASRVVIRRPGADVLFQLAASRRRTDTMHRQRFPRRCFLFDLRPHTFHVQRGDAIEQPYQLVGSRQAGPEIHADTPAEDCCGGPVQSEHVEQPAAVAIDLRESNGGMLPEDIIRKRGKCCCVAILPEKADHCRIVVGHETIETGFVEDGRHHERHEGVPASKAGAKARHGPHHGAQKSTITVSLPVTTCSKLSLVKATVAMNRRSLHASLSAWLTCRKPGRAV